MRIRKYPAKKSIKKIALLFSITLLVLACDGRKEKPSGNNPDELYYEIVQNFENQYNSDGLLEKVVETQYFSDNNLLGPDNKQEYVYEYELVNGTPIQTKRYAVDTGGEKTLTKITNHLPGKEEIIEVRDNDTVYYELKQSDEKGRIILEKKWIKTNRPDFDLIADILSEYHYFYDEEDREYRKITRTILDGEEDKMENTIRFDGNTDKVLSEEWRDLVTGEEYIYTYKTEYAGDTVIQKVYLENEIGQINKKVSGYKVESFIGENGEESRSEIFTEGEFRTEVFWDITTSASDSLYYKNDQLIREVRIKQDTRIIREYQYDIHNNFLQLRTQAWMK